MVDSNISVEERLLTCEVCLKEIPGSAVIGEEVDDYVYYLCGADCYNEWQKQNKKGEG